MDNTDKCKQFAKICNKYGLKQEEEDTFWLFMAYYHEVKFHHTNFPFLDQPDNSIDSLEALKLIRLIRHGRGLVLSSADGGKVSLSDGKIMDSICDSLIAELVEDGAYSDFCEAIGWSADYSDESLTKMETEMGRYEAILKRYNRAMDGKNGNRIPQLGLRSLFLLGQLNIGDYRSMSEIDKYNIVADLLQAAGVLLAFKDEYWIQNEWEHKDRKDRKDLVASWIRSGCTALKKCGGSIDIDKRAVDFRTNTKRTEEERKIYSLIWE